MHGLSRKAWSRVSPDEVRRLLRVDIATGLSREEVVRRQTLYGENRPRSDKEDVLSAVLLGQFRDLPAIVLVMAAIVSASLGAWLYLLIILLALGINVVIGTVQELHIAKVYRSLDAARNRYAIVLRDGSHQSVWTEALVPGDILILQPGDVMPADVYIIEDRALVLERTNGRKHTVTSKTLAHTHERIRSGHGKGVIVTTGEKAGVLAKDYSYHEDKNSALPMYVETVSRNITYATALGVAVVATLGMVRGIAWEDLLLLAVALFVATLPAGLPVAIRTSVVQGMASLLSNSVIIRSENTLTALARASILLIDKTGTIADEAGIRISSLNTFEGIQGSIRSPRGDNKYLLELAVLHAHAFFLDEHRPPTGDPRVYGGTPIDRAIVLSGLEAGVLQADLEKEQTRLDTVEFSPVRRWSASLYSTPKRKSNRLVMMGAPDTIIRTASSFYLEGARTKIDDDTRTSFAHSVDRLTRAGKRVVALAYKDINADHISEEQSDTEGYMRNTVLVGYVAFDDLPYAETRKAVRQARVAGLDVYLVTGDDARTAHYAASTAGITKESLDTVVRGPMMEEWNDSELYTHLQNSRVVAEASPEQKARIAEVFRRNKEVVVMTGDNAQDVSLLCSVDVGVAVASATPLTRESSPVELLQGGVATILRAIEEGRRTLRNARKTVTYLLATAPGEMVLVAGALAGSAVLPVLPLQIIWANVIKESMLSFLFAFDRSGDHVGAFSARVSFTQSLLTPRLREFILAIALATGGILLMLFYALLWSELPIETVRTILFVVLSLDAIIFALALRSLHLPLWRMKKVSNPHLLVAILLSIGLLVLTFMWHPLRDALSLVPLGTYEVVLIAGMVLIHLFVIEAGKYVFIPRDTKNAQW
jgi:P-type Ca2+ transporter type 2C